MIAIEKTQTYPDTERVYSWQDNLKKNENSGRQGNQSQRLLFGPRRTLRNALEKYLKIKISAVEARTPASEEERELRFFLREEHHRAYGRAWFLGREQFDFLVANGLRPEHKVLDVGCGALRTGIWIIPYLNEANYFGIEAHYLSLKAAARYEIPLHNLESKKPRLLHNKEFNVDHFGQKFDCILVFSVLNFLTKDELHLAMSQIERNLGAGGRIFVTHGLPLTAIELKERYNLCIRSTETTTSKLLLENKETVWTILTRAQ